MAQRPATAHRSGRVSDEHEIIRQKPYIARPGGHSARADRSPSRLGEITMARLHSSKKASESKRRGNGSDTAFFETLWKFTVQNLRAKDEPKRVPPSAPIPIARDTRKTGKCS
jgi:hypothetical protein